MHACILCCEQNTTSAVQKCRALKVTPCFNERVFDRDNPTHCSLPPSPLASPVAVDIAHDPAIAPLEAILYRSCHGSNPNVSSKLRSRQLEYVALQKFPCPSRGNPASGQRDEMIKIQKVLFPDEILGNVVLLCSVEDTLFKHDIMALAAP